MGDGANDRSDGAGAPPRRNGNVVKNLVYAVSGLVALLILAALTAPFVVDLNGYKDEISARLKAMTGRDLTIAGSIDLSILPLPKVAVNDVRLSNAAGAAVPHMVLLKAAEAGVALWPLLRGELRVESLAFIEPVIEVEVLAGGGTNWEFTDDGTGATGAADSGFGAQPGRLKVENATIVYRDTLRGVIELIEDVNADAVAESLGGPFRANGSLVARGAHLDFGATVGALAQHPVPVGAELELASVEASLSFAGSLRSASAGLELAGKLTAEGASLAGVVSAFVPAAASHAVLERGFQITGTMSGSAAGAMIDDIELDLGGVRGAGSVQAAFDGGPRLDAVIAFDRVDLDKLLSEAPSAGEGRGRAGDRFELPAKVNATVDLRVDALVLNAAEVREVRIVTTLDQGLLTLQQGSASLPGGSGVNVFGVLDSTEGAPRFLGQVEGAADNLRAVLDWLKVPLPRVPGDRLRNVDFSAQVEITPDLIRLAALDLAIDDSRLKGGVSLLLHLIPSFTAIVSLDRFDLDSYLPPAAGGEPAGEKDKPGHKQLAKLPAIEGQLKAHVGNLVYREVPISGLVIDAAVEDGKVRLRRVVADDVAGATGSVSGLVDPSTRAFDLTYDVNAADSGRFLRGLGVTTPAPVAALGALEARGSIEGDFVNVALDANVVVAGAEAKLIGTVSGIDSRPIVDAVVDVRGEKFEQLVERLDVGAPPGSARMHGAYSLVGKFAGDGQGAEVNFDAMAVGGRAKLNGTITGIADNPAYDVTLSAVHPDFAAFVEMLLDGVELERKGPSEIRLLVRAVGDSAQTRVSITDATIGPTRLSGVVEGRLDGTRPSLRAEIAAGEIDLDMYLPGAAIAALGADGSESPPPAERWSRAPIDLSALHAVDAKLRLAADAMKIGKHRFEAVSLALKLTDGALEIDELAGRLYGAPISLTARLADENPPTAAVAFSLDGADLRALLIDDAGADAVSGRLDLSGKFHTRGESTYELISALAGEATVDARDGMIRGVDIALLNQRLGALVSEAEFVHLSEAALRGGRTRVHGLQGRLTAANGVLSSSDLRAVLDGGQGRGEVVVDLPRWRVALDGTFSLADHPNAPLVGVALEGSIDDPKRDVRDRELRAYVVRKLLGGNGNDATPTIGNDAGSTAAAMEALNRAVAPKSAPLEASADGAKSAHSDGAKPDPGFNDVLKGIIKGKSD
jgi:uncharacterized protein involved in outer membrane biogenesis